MKFEAHDGGMLRMLAVFVATAILAGCGNGGSEAGSVASSEETTSGTSASAGATSSPIESRAAGALVALSASQYTAAPASNAVVTIYRTGPSAGSASVNYTTVDGTATAGVDYAATSGSVTWNDGESGAKTVTVPVTNNAGGRVFNVALVSVAGDAGFGSPSSAAVEVSTASSTSSSSSGASNSSGSSSSSGAASTTSTGTATLTWSAPTENTNGSALTNLAGYTIYYGTSPSAMTQKISINTVGLLSYVIDDLSSGNWYFQVLAVNSSGVESNPSPTVSTTI